MLKGDMMAWEDENGKVVNASKDQLRRSARVSDLYSDFNCFRI